ncbi:unnamed protein product [Orchesella dallaii]|uniref:Uncharacterized protein n=1 Tax=Orchesella dallaii TaxID=48710 RepID=A0ABP1QM71_9HEXA
MIMNSEPVLGLLILENVKTASALESVAQEVEVIIPFLDHGIQICRLRLYFKKVEVAQDDDFKFHCLSLCAQVLDKDAELKRLSFNIKVDCMTASLSVHSNKIPEKKITVMLDDGGEEIVIVKHFLYYNYVPIPKKDFSGEPPKEMYLMASVGTFRYCITTTMFYPDDSKKPKQELKSKPTFEVAGEVAKKRAKIAEISTVKEYIATQIIKAARNYLLSSEVLDKAKVIFDTRDPHYENLDIWFDIISGVNIFTCDINYSEENWMEGLVEAGKKIGIDHFTELIEEIMVKLCSADNMYELHDLAKKHQLKTALERIVIFIEKWQHLMEED